MMIRNTFALLLAVTFAVHTAPIAVASAQGQVGTGLIQGTAQNSAGQALPNFTVQLRDVQTGQLTGSTRSDADGRFAFAGLNPGNYVVEIVNSAGQIVGASSAIAMAAGATATITVTAAAATLLNTTGTNMALIITTVAAGAGITGLVVAVSRDEASASQ
jgi:hypothetical protein